MRTVEWNYEKNRVGKVPVVPEREFGTEEGPYNHVQIGEDCGRNPCYGSPFSRVPA